MVIDYALVETTMELELQIWLLSLLQDEILYVDVVEHLLDSAKEFLDSARDTWRQIDPSLLWGFLKATLKDAWQNQSFSSIATLSIVAIIVLYVLQSLLSALQFIVKAFRAFAKLADIFVSTARTVLWITKLAFISAFVLFIVLFAHTIYYDGESCRFLYQEKFFPCQPK